MSKVRILVDIEKRAERILLKMSTKKRAGGNGVVALFFICKGNGVIGGGGENGKNDSPFCKTSSWSPCGTLCGTSRDSRPVRRT